MDPFLFLTEAYPSDLFGVQALFLSTSTRVGHLTNLLLQGDCGMVGSPGTGAANQFPPQRVTECTASDE
jgi:hypothetical protein